jgi:uncharacterized protein (DUF1330 family)
MSEKVTVIVAAKPNPEEKESLMGYTSQATPMFGKRGAKVTSKYGTDQVIAGEDGPMLTLVAEFPNQAAVDDLFNSEEYKAIIPLRDKGFSYIHIYAGKDIMES